MLIPPLSDGAPLPSSLEWERLRINCNTRGKRSFFYSFLKLLLLIIIITTTKFFLLSQASCPASQTMAPISWLPLQPAWSWVVFATTLMAAVISHGLATAVRRKEWQGKYPHAAQQGQAREQWTTEWHLGLEENRKQWVMHPLSLSSSNFTQILTPQVQGLQVTWAVWSRSAHT